MLKLLHRHVFKEISIATLLAVGLFVFVLLVGNALKAVVAMVATGKLDVVVFLQIMGLLIPYVAVWALPMGMLTGTLMALGRLSSQQEITAMKAAGRSLYQIAMPVFLIAAVGMMLGLVVNLKYGPESRVLRKQILAQALTDNPLGFIEQKRFIDEFPGHIIYLGGRDGRTMKDFWIWVLDDDKRVTQFIRAAEGELDFDKAENSLVLTLRDGTAEQRAGDDPEALADAPMRSLFFDELPIALSLGELFGEKNQRRIKTKERTYMQLMALREAELAKEAEEGLTMTPYRLEIQMHIQQNFAMAFSVFSLAIFGVPLAIQIGRKETSANLGIALAIALTYYFMMIMVTWLEDVPALRPDLLMWLPNILFLSVGFYLLRRAGQR